MNRYSKIAAFCLAALMLGWSTGVAAAASPPAGGSAGISPSVPETLIRKTEHHGGARISRYKALARDDLRSGRFADAYHRLRPSLAHARGDVEYLALLAVAALRMGSHGSSPNGEAGTWGWRLPGSSWGSTLPALTGKPFC